MTDDTHNLFISAINGRYSSLKDTLSEEDVCSIWDDVASYVEKQLIQIKGVHIPTLGTFSVSQRKIEVASNKYVIIQRPVFNISEKFASLHGLQFQKYLVPGSIPVLPLNFASISYESPFDRDTVEQCVKETLRAASLAVAAKRNVELRFTGIGRLTIWEGRVKMKFYKEFMNSMDSTGRMADTLMNRAGTADSVISNHSSVRCQSSNTVILPRVKSNFDLPNTFGLTPINEDKADFVESTLDGKPESPVLRLAAETSFDKADGSELWEHVAEPNEEITELDIFRDCETRADNGTEGGNNQPIVEYSREAQHSAQPETRLSRCETRAGSKTLFHIPKANGVSLYDDLDIPHAVPKQLDMPKTFFGSLGDFVDNGILKPPTPPPVLSPPRRPRSCQSRLSASSNFHGFTPPPSACSHSNAGQELCYLCHQFAKRNQPIYFTKELKRREEEEDRLLQQFHTMKDMEAIRKEQENQLTRRQDQQKTAAYNLGVAEALQAQKNLKDPEPQKYYIFKRRPLTPPLMLKQEEYLRELNTQVQTNERARQKRKADEEFLERLEQVQLAQDLAAQRTENLKQKADATHNYKKALDTQVKSKPPELPDKEADTEIFGKNDTNQDKLAERRRKAIGLFQEQQALVQQKKREAILAKLAEQQQEEKVLKKTRDDLRLEGNFRHMFNRECRKNLEKEWHNMAEAKRTREVEDRMQFSSPGILVHEQCDRYRRCRQCKRRLNNGGESNIWKESRYIPGTRIMV